MPTTNEVRTWASANGIRVGDRGRLSPKLVEAYEAAQAQAKEDKKKARELARAERKAMTLVQRVTTPRVPAPKIVRNGHVPAPAERALTSHAR